MDKIIIHELEVFYRVGVPEEERAQPQRLLLTVELTHHLARAAKSDELTATIDYYAVCQRLLGFGDERSWQLIEKVAGDIADSLLRDFGAQTISVEVKKFIIPQARYVAVQMTRTKKERGQACKGS